MRYFIVLFLSGITLLYGQEAQTSLKPKSTAQNLRIRKQKAPQKPVIKPPSVNDFSNVVEDNNAEEYYPVNPYAGGNYTAVIQRDSLLTQKNAQALGIFSCTDDYLQKELIKYTALCIANGQPLFTLKYYARRLDNEVYTSPYTYTKSMFAVIYCFNKAVYLKDAGVEKETFVYPYDYMILVDAREKKTAGCTPFLSDTSYASKRVYLFK